MGRNGKPHHKFIPNTKTLKTGILNAVKAPLTFIKEALLRAHGTAQIDLSVEAFPNGAPRADS